jgi:hypothetical protein
MFVHTIYIVVRNEVKEISHTKLTLRYNIFNVDCMVVMKKQNTVKYKEEK